MEEQVIAKAVVVAGNAYVHNAIGELRLLDIGDVLIEGETVVAPDGASVELELVDGSKVTVHELSGRDIGRELVGEFSSQSLGNPNGTAPAVTPRQETPRFRGIAEGAAVQNVAGQNLFFDDRPLYWSLGESGSHCTRHRLCRLRRRLW